MPRLKGYAGGTDPDKAAEQEAGSGGNFYDEEERGVPPKGVYRGSVKRLSLKKNKNNDWMLNCVIEINEPSKSKKSYYNGYGIWWNGNLTDQGMGYVNQFIEALGGDKTAKKAIWGPGPKVDDAKAQQPKVLALGPNLKIEDEMPIIVNTRGGKKLNGDPKLEVQEFLYEQKKSDEYDEDEEDGEDEDTEPEDDEDDEDDEEGESGEQSDKDDDDEPPF